MESGKPAASSQVTRAKDAAGAAGQRALLPSLTCWHLKDAALKRLAGSSVRELPGMGGFVLQFPT